MIQDETDYLASLWPDGLQPKSSEPQLDFEGQTIRIFTAGEWNSIGYQITVSGEEPNSNGWSIYTSPIESVEGKTIHAIANRIGYLPSGIVSLEM